VFTSRKRVCLSAFWILAAMALLLTVLTTACCQWCTLSCLFSDVPDILEPLLPKSRDVAAADDDLQRDSDQHAGTASDSTGDKQQHVGNTQQSSDLTVFVGEC
jgi:hypothetical protein